MVSRFQHLNPNTENDVFLGEGKYSQTRDSEFFLYVLSFVVNGGQVGYY